MALTILQQRFVELYDGNATESAKKAGYSSKSAEKIGRDLLRNTTVAEAIRRREEQTIKPLIASRQRRQEFWTATMQDAEQAMRDRLKASELLGRSEGDFLERHDLTSSDGSLAPVTIDLSHLSADEILTLTRAAFDGDARTE